MNLLLVWSLPNTMEMKLSLVLCIVSFGHVIATDCQEIIGGNCTVTPVKSNQDEHVELWFYRCDEGLNVKTTIEIYRRTPADPIFVLDLRINERQGDSFTCPDHHGKEILNWNGTAFGHVAFPDKACSKAVIVIKPPPTVNIQLTIYVNNGSKMKDYGPYDIGKAGLLFPPRALVDTIVLLLTNITGCNIPYAVNLHYGNDSLILHKNGSTSPSESQCMIISSTSCSQNNNTLKLVLNLNREGCMNPSASTIMAQFADAIQKAACINVPALEPTSKPSLEALWSLIVVILIILAIIACTIIVWCKKKSAFYISSTEEYGVTNSSAHNDDNAETVVQSFRQHRGGRPGLSGTLRESNNGGTEGDDEGGSRYLTEISGHCETQPTETLQDERTEV